MKNVAKIQYFATIICILSFCSQADGWSNRGHRMVNLIAANFFPPDMPDFMRSAEAVNEISYLGPEPDRWRPLTEPELSAAASPDHAFRIELGITASPLPRRRFDFYRKLQEMQKEHPADADQLAPQRIGTLPWQADEIFERLKAAFRSYRIITGEFAPNTSDLAPMTKADLPYVEASARFYAGWLGHYIGDGCQPLHDTVNVAGWILKDNPHGYTTKGEIHHRFEVVVDNAIADGSINAKAIQSRITSKPHLVKDPFADTLDYLQSEGQYAENVYKMDKAGEIQGSGDTALRQFVEQRMAEGGAMLSDLIYSAWVDSKNMDTPSGLPAYVPLSQGKLRPTPVLSR